MRRVELHPIARYELLEAAQYLDAERAGYGARFDEAVREAEDLVADYPEAGERVRGIRRRRQVAGFRYQIIYDVFPDLIYVVAVSHHSRRPQLWRGRRRP